MERKEEKMRICKSEAILGDTSDTDSWAECVEKISHNYSAVTPDLWWKKYRNIQSQIK